MGNVHNELRASALQQAIRDAVGGNMEVEIERIGETITPVLDIWTLPEWFQLRSCKRFAIGGVPLAANVAGIARFQVSNPAGSGVITVIEELSVMEQTATAAYIVTDSGAFIAGGLAPLSALDTRYAIAAGGGSRPTVTLQTVDNTAAANSGIFVDENEAITGGAPARFLTCVPFVLTPGNWIQIQSTSVNHQARFQCRGYERLAFPGEL